ncbi:hypothetical protein RFI_18128 [Reticulomyxa filosa]|uniref:Uncharacterized protein n=1 Tax=Reticulomyxa filosa TaxID=46433 RepID=X6N042_RETFI|nr:hypothetical protein RFI_18128 [Reticulomyxa filosa]|eukprot:ETO19109.1 hypothetical protein RFI_18128 [Reticulomyxa filosa]
MFNRVCITQMEKKNQRFHKSNYKLILNLDKSKTQYCENQKSYYLIMNWQQHHRRNLCAASIMFAMFYANSNFFCLKIGVRRPSPKLVQKKKSIKKKGTIKKKLQLYHLQKQKRMMTKLLIEVKLPSKSLAGDYHCTFGKSQSKQRLDDALKKYTHSSARSSANVDNKRKSHLTALSISEEGTIVRDRTFTFRSSCPFSDYFIIFFGEGGEGGVRGNVQIFLKN